MMIKLGDDGVVSSVNEEELIYVDKKELERLIDSYYELEKENEQLKKQCAEQQLRITKLQHENAGLIEYLGKLENETFKGVK